MNIPKHYLTYPANVYAPRTVSVLDDYYTLYGFHFKGLHDFQDFLSKNPEINCETFRRKPVASMKKKQDFYGRPYDETLANLTKAMDPGYQEYLRIQKEMVARIGSVHKYHPMKSISGGGIDPVAYATSSPEIYRVGRIVAKPKFITIDTQIAYYHGTSKKQVFNRAVIISNLIRALERNGYNVDVNSFMVVKCDTEIIQAIFEIKRHGHRLNYQTLYRSLVDVEFFRRLCFRLMEISSVEDREWEDGYGETCGESFVRELLKLKKEDIYFDQPEYMDISGEDIGNDFERAVNNLHLENYIDVPREKELLRKCVKVLRR